MSNKVIVINSEAIRVKRTGFLRVARVESETQEVYALSEVVDAEYDHPDASGYAIVHVLEQRIIGRFSSGTPGFHAVKMLYLNQQAALELTPDLPK